jgi:predicted negative regulator of RcsB-dependent stress response
MFFSGPARSVLAGYVTKTFSQRLLSCGGSVPSPYLVETLRMKNYLGFFPPRAGGLCQLLVLILVAHAADDTPLSTAMAAFKQGHYAEAKASVEDGLKQTPGEPHLLVLQGRIALAEKKTTEALALFKSALAQKDCPATVHIYRGDALLVSGEAAAAQEAYETFLAQDKSLKVRLRVVYAQIQQNNFAAAQKTATQLDPLDAINPAYFFAQAALNEARGDSSGAKVSLERARTNYGNAIFADYYGDYLLLTKK